jgi:3-dehydroquinate synthetase
MRQDKKVKDNKIHFVLPKGIGNCVIVDDLTEQEIKAALVFLTKDGHNA